MNDKPQYFYRQSAVVPYRIRQGDVEILLITSRSKKRWVLPKGIQEPDLSAADSAANEALEEAGVEGQTGVSPIGHYTYEKWGGTCTVEVYPMEVERIHDTWLENNRDRVWVSTSEAANRVDEPVLKEILKDFDPRSEVSPDR
jgi:phosphohistidine phosphatase